MTINLESSQNTSQQATNELEADSDDLAEETFDNGEPGEKLSTERNLKSRWRYEQLSNNSEDASQELIDGLEQLIESVIEDKGERGDDFTESADKNIEGIGDILYVINKMIGFNENCDLP